MLQFFGLPDYSFEDLHVPDWLYNKQRAMPVVVKRDAEEKPDSEQRPPTAAPKASFHHPARRVPPAKRVPQPSAEAANSSPPRDVRSEASPGGIDALDVHPHAQEASAGMSLQGWPTAQGDEEVPEQVLRGLLHVHPSDDEEVPSPPEDLGFYKVPRTAGQGPSLADPLLTQVEAVGHSGNWTAWLPTLCNGQKESAPGESVRADQIRFRNSRTRPTPTLLHPGRGSVTQRPSPPALVPDEPEPPPTWDAPDRQGI